tara:strand:- start:603 stop:785 length:183 start_codon:yes stop_codon:yes gene_type:complete
MKKLNMKQKEKIRHLEKVLSNIKYWLEYNIEQGLYEKDLITDNKQLLKFIDEWNKQDETV